MDMERLVVKLTADVLQYNRAMDGAEARIGNFARSILPLGAMIDVPLLAVAGGVTAVGVALGAAAYEAIKLASGFERARIAMEVMTGSAFTAKAILDDLVKLGIETPFKTTELIAAAQILKGYNVENQNLVDTLRVLGDVAQGDAGKLNRIALAFGQVKSAGRLMGQEMRQFINAGAISNEDLAKVMGVHPSRVKTMIEEAKVSFGTVIKAFNLATGPEGRFFNINDRLNKTVAGQWSALIETGQLGLIRMGEAFFKEFKIADTLHEWSQALRSTEGQFDKFFHSVHEGFTLFVNSIKAAVFWIEKGWNASEKWIQENQAFLKSLLRVAAIVTSLIATILVASYAVGVLGAAFSLMATPLGLLIAGLTTVTLLLEQFGYLENVGSGFGKALGMMGDAFKLLGPGLKDALLAEDWELVGKIISKGLEIGFKGFLSAIKWEIASVLGMMMSDFGLFFEHLAKATKIAGIYWKEFFTPGADNDKALEDYNIRIGGLQKEMDKRRAGQAIEFNLLKMKEVDKDMAPLLRDLEDLRRKAGMAAGAKRERDREAADPTGTAIEKLVKEQQDLHERGLYDITDRFNKKLITEDQGKKMVAEGAAVSWASILGGVTGVVVKDMMEKAATTNTGNKIPVPFEYQPDTIQYVARLTREMERGQWAGEATDKLDLFFRNISTINEAYLGPVARRGKEFDALTAVAGGMFLGAMPAPLIGPKERDFAMYEEFSNLRRAMGGKREDRLAPALFAGSTEAMDAVNKANLRQTSVQEQVRDLLIESAEYQKQNRDYMRAVVEELKKLNGANPGDDGTGGGGDF
jgi:tape measure domain-containing protein